jgi:nucleoside-diphosphate-sugar epimerase
MTTVLVTGAAGLVGGNVCRLLTDRGTTVRGLVRDPAAAPELTTLGVELLAGDVRDPAAVAAAVRGCTGVVHAAGLLGGPHQDLDEHRAVNAVGAQNVFDAAASGGQRVVHISTLAVLDQRATVTEDSPIDPGPQDPYSQTKRRAHQDALDRARSGQDVVVVVPSSVYGSGPSLRRAVGPTSFNRVIRGAVNGRLTHYPATSSVWVHSHDVALAVLAALDAGSAGATYLAVGADDAIPSPEFFSLACELAGVSHRVRPLQIDVTSPDAVATYGESIVNALSRVRPTPAVDSAWTRKQLDLSPMSARAGLAETVAWLADSGQLNQ